VVVVYIYSGFLSQVLQSRHNSCSPIEERTKSTVAIRKKTKVTSRVFIS
jgi:hypothetical protein